MAKCGLFIPCEKALCHSFSEIYVNMGDQQNREEDLSTFSGHLQHIKTILECANHSSLVLLDEGFVGTDPAMGVAIAQAVLEELASKGATVVITTHFSALKTLAIEGSVFKNASMEFESQYLRPTYKLLQNLPGQSYALELCERLGFNHNMINSAKKYYGENPRNFESLLKELQQKSSDLQKIQQKHENLHQNLIEEFENLKNEKVQFQNWRDNIIENYTNKLQKRLNSFENKLEIKERQHEKNLKIRLRKLKNPTITSDPPKSEELLAEVQEAKKKMENSFHHIEERLGTEDHTTLKTKPNLVKTIKESHKKITESKTHYRPANFWQMGMKVKTTRFDQAGIVLKPADHKGLIECQFQFMKVKLPFEDLMTIEDSAKHQTKKNDIISKKIPIPINKTKEANNKLNYEIETVLPHKGNSIDLRGLRVEESIQELEQKLDKLFSDNLTHGVIVHGHGEGKVKEAVRKHLFKCSYSLNFRPGRHGEGGDGVTVVEFL